MNENPTGDETPELSLYDRPVPNFIEIDVEGLLRAWLMQAEEWLTAYGGPESLNDQEAFEGIACLARLSRMRPELHLRESVQAAITKLTTVLKPLAPDVVQRAIRYPDLTSWRAHVEKAWIADDDDPQLAETLIGDLDAADWVPWFASQSAKTSATSDPFHQYLEDLRLCHDVFHQHLVMFCAAEGYIRAVGKTLSEEIEADEGGWLTSSNWKYFYLLNELDIDTESSSEESRRLVLGLTTEVRPLDQLSELVEVPGPASAAEPSTRLPHGPQEADWKVHELAPNLGAATSKLRASAPGFCWRDPTRTYEAEITWPTRLESDGDHKLELMFGTGEHYTEAAQALAGQQFQLGNAFGIIEISGEGDEKKAAATISYSEVTCALSGELRLSVAGIPWNFHNES